LQIEETKKKLELAVSQIESEVESEKKKLLGKLEEQENMSKIHDSELAREKASQEQQLAIAQKQLEQRLAELKAEVQAVVEKAHAISPNLIATLQAFADKELAKKVAQTMSPLAILGGKSVADVFAQLLHGTVLEDVLKKSS
jgi:major vault protein